jgi:hypothetical protein
MAEKPYSIGGNTNRLVLGLLGGPTPLGSPLTMCLIVCGSRKPKRLLLHLTKRSHGCERVHIVPPLHDLSALDGNDRDEPVVV